VNRRTRSAEAVAIITRFVDAAWKARPSYSDASRPSAFTIAKTLDRLQRAAVKVGRLHEAECNGDHERCAWCLADARDAARCAKCGGTGRKSDDEIKEWLLARDAAERRIEKMLRADLGFRHPAEPIKKDGPTFHIERDPRAGPVRIYADERDREQDRAAVVFPVEGF
jgi:hypothetical protein